MKTTPAQIIEFATLDNDHMDSVMISDRSLSLRLRARHCRSGRIDARCGVKEARGVEVHAYKPDGLGGVIALCKDGHIRQFSA